MRQIINFNETNLKIRQNSNRSVLSKNEVYYFNKAFIVTLPGYIVSSKSPLNDIISQLSIATRIVLHDVTLKNKDKYRYRDALYNASFLRGLAQWACGGYCTELLYNILNCFSDWSIKTYERNRVKFGVIVQSDIKSKSKNDFLSYIKKEISATISDGEHTIYLLDKDGKIDKVGDIDCILNLLTNGDSQSLPKHTSLAPTLFSEIGLASYGCNLGVTLSGNGEICVFKAQQLVLARLNGQWTVFDYSSLKNIFLSGFKNEISDNLIRNIYLSCLDVAFAGTGGCIAVIKPSAIAKVDTILPSTSEYKTKVGITDHYNNNFINLSRNLRKELLAIDGACVLYNNGDIRAFGAIVNSIKPQKTGGARAAAASTLSKYGVAIKISADGYLQVYLNGKKI